MKIQSVIAFGDSTTAGCELIDGSEEWAETKKLSFANTLAAKKSKIIARKNITTS